MFACIHMRRTGMRKSDAGDAPTLPDVEAEALLALASRFSPKVEAAAPDTVIFDISSLRRILGSPEAIASEIARRAHEVKITGNIAIAATPDTAILAARNRTGVTMIPPGEEQRVLGNLSVAVLPVNIETLAVLDSWGIRTISEFCRLPEAGVLERLGSDGLRVLQLANGKLDRPLRPNPLGTSYEERLETEHPVSLLEPLSFLLSRLLSELCARLRSQSRATSQISLTLELENRGTHTRTLQLPFATHDSRVFLKLLQMDLEAHPPQAAVVALKMSVIPVEPRAVQSGLYMPPVPEPEKLELTLGKIRQMVGVDNVGTPELLDTHRPDAWRLLSSPAAAPEPELHVDTGGPREFGLRLAFRYFRPPLSARVEIDNRVPRRVFARGIYGNITRICGPWRSSGDWWNILTWNREEWDIALNDGGLYRLFSTQVEQATRSWFLEGVYD